MDNPSDQELETEEEITQDKDTPTIRIENSTIEDKEDEQKEIDMTTEKTIEGHIHKGTTMRETIILEIGEIIIEMIGEVEMTLITGKIMEIGQILETIINKTLIMVEGIDFLLIRKMHRITTQESNKKRMNVNRRTFHTKYHKNQSHLDPDRIQVDHTVQITRSSYNKTQSTIQ